MSAGALAALDEVIADMGGALPGTTGHKIAQARAAVAELIEANRKLTAAVRGFADGEMSTEVRERLFLSKYDGPEQATFSAMCDACDEAEHVLALAAGGEA